MTYRVACPLCSPHGTTGARGSLLPGAMKRINFQPRSTDTPDGWTADTGTAKGTFPSGWNKKGGWPFACDREHLGRPLYDTFIQLQALAVTAPGLTGSWSIDLPNGTYPVVLMCGDATSRAQTNTLSLNGKTVVDSTPYDGRITNGYERGSFDGYAVQVVVTNGRLTIAAAKGGWNAKINFIEIGARGALLDQATRDRVTAAAAEATRATANEKAAVPPMAWSRPVVNNTVAGRFSLTV